MEESSTSIFAHNNGRIKNNEEIVHLDQYANDEKMMDGNMESNGHGWEAKIMDRVSKMTISKATAADSVPVPTTSTPPKQVAALHSLTAAASPCEMATPPAAEVSFSADDLESTVSNPDSYSPLFVSNMADSFNTDNDISRKTSPLRSRNYKRDFSLDMVSTPRSETRQNTVLSEAETPQASNSYRTHRRKKSRTNISTPNRIQQPCFSPFRTKSTLQVDAQLQDQLKVRRQCSFDHGFLFPASEEGPNSDDSACTLTPTVTSSRESSTTTSPIVWKAGVDSPSSLRILWLQPDSSQSLLRRKRRKRILKMRSMKSSSVNNDDKNGNTPPGRSHRRVRSIHNAMAYTRHNHEQRTPNCTPMVMGRGGKTVMGPALSSSSSPARSFLEEDKMPTASIATESMKNELPQVPFFPLLSPFTPVNNSKSIVNIHGKDDDGDGASFTESSEMCRALPEL